MKTRWAIPVVVLALAACGSDEDGTTADTSAPQSTIATPSTSAPPAMTSTMPLSEEPDLIAMAAALLGEWADAWEAHDAEGVAAVFTDDGIYVNPFGEVVTGHEAMKAYVDRHGSLRDPAFGEIIETETGTFQVPFAFEALAQDGWKEGSGDLEVELDGGLAARIEFLNFSGFH